MYACNNTPEQVLTRCLHGILQHTTADDTQQLAADRIGIHKQLHSKWRGCQHALHCTDAKDNSRRTHLKIKAHLERTGLMNTARRGSVTDTSKSLSKSAKSRDGFNVSSHAPDAEIENTPHSCQASSHFASAWQPRHAAHVF